MVYRKTFQRMGVDYVLIRLYKCTGLSAHSLFAYMEPDTFCHDIVYIDIVLTVDNRK